MCLNTYKLYPSNTKVYSRIFSEPMLVSYRCGHCAECLESLRKEWYFRAVHEFDDTCRTGGYMLFDCLTYAPKHVPRVSRYYSVPRELDFMCFDHQDTTNFLKDLRIRLHRAGYDVADNLRYYYATEYGSEDFTFRPHIHILFFVRNNFIDSLTLSQFISDCWKYGRTDGVAYKSKYYVQSHCVIKSDKGSSARVCSYVSKYVVKSLSYDNKLEMRINALMRYFFEEITERSEQFLQPIFGVDGVVESLFSKPRQSLSGLPITDGGFAEFCSSPRGKRIRASIKRVLDMYHRQSQGFGLSAIDGLDIDKLAETGCLTVRDSQKVVMRISLPTYYKRKLFQEQVEFNGNRCWQLTKVGLKYQNRRDIFLREKVKRRLADDCLNIGRTDIDVDELSRYLVDYRGRLRAPLKNRCTITDKMHMPNNFYSYCTPSDVQHYKMCLITNDWCGSSQTSYQPITGVPFDNFVRDFCYFDVTCEKWLHDIEVARMQANKGKDESFALKQHLKELYKSVFSL